jgi:3-oxoacyl-[acyl-carrier protein] reductase
MLTPISDKSVVVTGASRGIGKGIARVFARNGGRVLVVGRDWSAAEATVAEIVSDGGTASAFCGDVASWKDMQAMADMAAARHGGIDILVSNAGIYPEQPIDEMSGADWDTVMDANLKGNFHAVRACLPALKQNGDGRIVMISSITGPITGVAGWAHYGASKAGMLGFMRAAALEFAMDGITVNAVLPGNIVVESSADFTVAQVAAMNEAIPLGRMGDVEDIAYAALFLASREAAYITGQTIVVDGGQVLPEVSA